MNAQIKPIREQVLEYLQGKTPQRVADVATALQKDPANVHRVLRDLSDAGLVMGEASTGPNRPVVYSLIEDQTLAITPARDPTNPGANIVIPVTSGVPPRLLPPPVSLPDPARVIEPVRRRHRRLSNDDFMRTIERLRSDSDKLARIRAILEEAQDEAEETP